MGPLWLWKFCAPTGTKGSVEGVFAASEYAVQEAAGQRASLGDGSGESILVEEGHFTKVTDDDSFVQKFLALKLESGYNPLDWIQD